MKQLIFTYAVPMVVVAIGIYLSFKTGILRDSSPKDARPYSFARAQLMWWSLIIICAFSASFGNGQSLHLNESSLILLGISLGTNLGAKIIESTDKRVFISFDKEPRNFFQDILSDEKGLSVSRFQAVTFNIIFGGIFIYNFATNGVFTHFDAIELTLMGVSNATYLGIKMNETPGATTAVKSVGNETADKEDLLTDIDESYYLNQKR